MARQGVRRLWLTGAAGLAGLVCTPAAASAGDGIAVRGYATAGEMTIAGDSHAGDRSGFAAIGLGCHSPKLSHVLGPCDLSPKPRQVVRSR